MSIGPVMIQNATIATYTQSQSSHYACRIPLRFMYIQIYICIFNLEKNVIFC